VAAAPSADIPHNYCTLTKSRTLAWGQGPLHCSVTSFHTNAPFSIPDSRWDPLLS
jgi:hypothetical protein